MIFRQIVEPKLAQFSYLIGCESSGTAIVVDPQRDTKKYVQIANENNLRIVAVTETHIHADFLSGMRQFAIEHKAKVYASGEGGPDWQYEWLNDSDIDYQLLKNKDSFNIGSIRFEVHHTPGHTPEHLSFAVIDPNSGKESAVAILTGDFLLAGDVGRPDLLETSAGQTGEMFPSARQLFTSLQLCKSWPDDCRIFPGHGAGSVCAKSINTAPSSTVKYELNYNQSLIMALNNDEEQFVNELLKDQPEPPHYFSRMKRENKKGPAVLPEFSEPPLLGLDEIAKATKTENALLLDCRSWAEYRDGHLPGSLFTPVDGSFPTITGSYIDPDCQLYLLVEPEWLESAITDLIHVGLDNVAGFAPPSALREFEKTGGEIKRVHEIDVIELSRKIAERETFVLDVRRSAELRFFGQIAGAANVAHTRLLPDGNDLPRDREIHVHCRSGVRSTYACGFLERAGYDVVHVAGGFLAWQGTGQKVVLPE